MFLSSSLFCEYHNTETSQLYLSFALQAKEVWDIRRGHSACFDACSGDRQALPRVPLVMTAPWDPISHLCDEAVEGDKHFSLFLLQDMMWPSGYSSNMLYSFILHITLWIFFSSCLKYHAVHEGREKKKPSFFKFIFMQLVCNHNMLHHWHLVLSLDMKRERKENKQKIRNEITHNDELFLIPQFGFFALTGNDSWILSSWMFDRYLALQKNKSILLV